MKVRNNTVVASTILAIMVPLIALVASQRWVLPVADGQGPNPSPPSVHGYVVKASKQRISLKPETRESKVLDNVDVQLTSKTQFFTAYGGLYSPSDLGSGEYAWVWYVTANPADAGTPPRAGVVMVYSTSASDKPSREVRFSYDRQK